MNWKEFAGTAAVAAIAMLVVVPIFEGLTQAVLGRSAENVISFGRVS
jgi:hypothetical protein